MVGTGGNLQRPHVTHVFGGVNAMNLQNRGVLMALICASVACGADEGRDGSAFTSSASAPVVDDEGAAGDEDEDDPADDDDASDTESGGVDEDDDGPAESGEDPRFDLGATPDGGDAPIELGCHKIDFVFVIDNSQSMEDEQANLIANFPDFIEGIQGTLDDVNDYHVGVVTSDGYGYNAPGCTALGGLVTQTGGGSSSNATCGPYAEGHNFMTEQDDLGTTFSCAAQVGVGGWPLEVPMDALAATLDGGPGSCNDGFLRSDALLVVVLITDEFEGPGDPEFFPSVGTPQSWYDKVISTKAHPDNAAIVSLINYAGGPCEPMEPVFDGLNIKSFTELFNYGYVGGICADYGPIFQRAVSVVDEACMNFMPPG